ncbi:MAG: toxin of toxin-antitoxin system [uncultured bacterium]|nr:MAG: toxin of toxin-antitoxin system [uncultured bacterium]
MAFVLDFSVAISWLMPDEFFDSIFLDKTVKEGAVVPSIWSLEIGNVLLMAERQKRISAEQRHRALFTLSELPINVDVMTSQHAWHETMDIAERYKLTLYDATYLELALRCSLPLATLDKSLKRAAEEVGITTESSNSKH